MRTKNRILSLLLASVAFVGCESLDTEPMGDTITSDQKVDVVESQAEKAEAGVNAIFARFSGYNLGVGESKHDDIGFPSIMLYMDNNGHDVVTGYQSYNWQRYSLNYEDRDFSSWQSRITWNNLYSQILITNNTISTIGYDVEDSTSKYYLAQALAVRAFDYFTLAQLYQFNYATHKSDPCVPIITEENFDIVAIDGIERSTVEEVYTLINKDIDLAISLLEESDVVRSDNRYVSKEVAYGIRARINLVMHNYAEAAADATVAISGSAAPFSREAVSVPTFNDIEEWMWGIYVTETDDVGGLTSWASFIGPLCYGYSWWNGGYRISTKLWDLIPSTDVRKGWWTDENQVSPNLTTAQQEMVDLHFPSTPYVTVKYAPYNDLLGTSINASDVPLMRVEEMYLIKAEGEAMSGDIAAGKATLENFVKTYRDDQYVSVGTTAEEVQNEVLVQRRIEFWCEGVAWYDIMRLNITIDRRGCGYPTSNSIFYIEPEDPILLWRIPETEIQANPLLDNSDNNVATPVPTAVADVI